MTNGLLPDASGTPCRTLPDARPDAVEPGLHCVRTRWIRGFIAFQRPGACGLWF